MGEMVCALSLYYVHRLPQRYISIPRPCVATQAAQALVLPADVNKKFAATGEMPNVENKLHRYIHTYVCITAAAQAPSGMAAYILGHKQNASPPTQRRIHISINGLGYSA